MSRSERVSKQFSAGSVYFVSTFPLDFQPSPTTLALPDKSVSIQQLYFPCLEEKTMITSLLKPRPRATLRRKNLLIRTLKIPPQPQRGCKGVPQRRKWGFLNKYREESNKALKRREKEREAGEGSSGKVLFAERRNHNFSTDPNFSSGISSGKVRLLKASIIK